MKYRESIEKIANFLRLQDHSVVSEWSKLNSLKPFNKNSDKSFLLAREIDDSLNDVDIFVLISDKSGTDMFIELGIVIGRWKDNNKTRIYIVGKFNDRSLMHFHPSIKRVKYLSDVFSIECPELLTQYRSMLSNLFNQLNGC